jgi:sulfite exporter TauE/SafE
VHGLRQALARRTRTRALLARDVIATLWYAAFAAGLLGGVHCAGMCGGIVGSLSASSRGPVVSRQLNFNAGRIASYALAGAAAGTAGNLAQAAGPLLSVQVLLFAAANVLMILLGLYVAGWGKAVLKIERAGRIVWRLVEPAARRIFPIDSAAKAFIAGLLWGWVPCGLVYSLLALALASGGALQGASVMIAFGLGTLPTLLTAGFTVRKLDILRRTPWIRHVAGTAIAMMGVVGLARAPHLREAILAGWACLS